MVSLFCEDDNDCVINNNDNADGHWTIGRQVNGVRLADSAEGLWPHQVKSWEYWSRGWQPDPQLTVTGNVNINILCLNIDISTVEGAPGYPENLIVKDLTGDKVNLAGVYRGQGDSRVWKYGDYELSIDGKY